MTNAIINADILEGRVYVFLLHCWWFYMTKFDTDVVLKTYQKCLGRDAFHPEREGYELKVRQPEVRWFYPGRSLIRAGQSGGQMHRFS